MDTLAQALAALEDARTSEGLAPATLRSERAQLRAAVTAISTDAGLEPDTAPISACTPEALRSHLARYREGRDSRHLDVSQASLRRPSSVRARLQALRVLGRFLESEGLVPADPAASLRLRTPAPPRVRACTRAEVADLLTAAALGRSPERDRVLLLLHLTLGATLAEAAALTLADLDLEAAEVTLERGGRARVLTIPPSLARSLEAWLPVRGRRLARLDRTSSLLLVTALDPSQPVCSTASLGRALSRCFQRAGVDAADLGVQRLRATFATLALESGASVRELQDALDVEVAALRQLTHRARPRRTSLPPHPLGDL